MRKIINLIILKKIKKYFFSVFITIKCQKHTLHLVFFLDTKVMQTEYLLILTFDCIYLSLSRWTVISEICRYLLVHSISVVTRGSKSIQMKKSTQPYFQEFYRQGLDLRKKKRKIYSKKITLFYTIREEIYCIIIASKQDLSENHLILNFIQFGH